MTLALLTGIAIVSFLAVSALSRIYENQRESLADRWAQRGVDDLNSSKYQPAVVDFRTALLYSRDNGAYQLSLAEALMGLKRDNEAEAYLDNLWEREPDNGVVSLELARIAAAKGETERALRYYHNAIYATWPGNPDTARRKARLELIDYLLRIDARPQADAELIDLAANVEAPGQEVQLGQMFAKVGDYQRALAAFRAALRRERHNAQALQGAGDAAFQLGLYPEAEAYLRGALAAAPANTQIAEQLSMAETVLHWDPFRQEVPQSDRNRIALEAFAAAGKRLQTCTPPTPQEQALLDSWQKLKPQITPWGLRRHPDLLNTVMDQAFEIERQTASNCGPQTDTDRALLLVDNLHEEN